MPNYWRVSPNLWMKPWSDDAKLLALYLLTCSHRELEGLYRLPKAYICADLGWDSKRLGKPFRELLLNRFMHYDERASVVLIRKALKYQAPENPNQIKHALAYLDTLPVTPLITGLWAAAKLYAEPLAKPLMERFGKGFGKPPSPPPPPSPSPPPKKKGGAFAPPSLSEVQAYAREKGYRFDPDAFHAFYESKGWKVGAQPMRSWQAACVTWQKRAEKDGAPRTPRPGIDDTRREQVKNLKIHRFDNTAEVAR